MPELILHGCTPEPLMNYLKALGVFRIVTEQADPTCRAAWSGGQFVIHSALDQEALVMLFLEEYEPSPVVVPWSDKHFFEVGSSRAKRTFKKTPTGSTLIEAFLTNDSPRFSNYRGAIQASLDALATAGIMKKEDMKDAAKAGYLACLRSHPVPRLDEWIDAAAALPGDKLRLNTLLGSGGGSDGRAHFSDNFMQNLWEMLPDFDAQKSVRKEVQFAENAAHSRELLANALFEEPTDRLEPGRTSSLYHSGAVGGPNAGQGFERKAFANPWSFILTIEGTIAFSGSVTRRLSSSAYQAVFPFQTHTSATESDSLSQKEHSGRELWLPLWQRPCRYLELRALLGEGRSDWSGKPAERGVDFAKAVASLGIDRGVSSFARYAILKGRVGGDNYCTAAHLGRFDVRVREDVHLLREADSWIDRYRRACGDKTPARFSTALGRIDSAVFDFCQQGGNARFQAILVALGQAERELVTGAKFRESGWLRPLRELSPAWVAAADDHSREFEIAVALAGIRGGKDDPGIRANLEPVEWSKGLSWREGSSSVVWNRGDLAANLVAVLERRVLDWRRLGLSAPSITSCRRVRPSTVAAFIHAELDDAKIERLLWGLICCRIDWSPVSSDGVERAIGTAPLPRLYPILKASLSGLHPDSARPEKLDSGQAALWEKLIHVTPEARLPHLLRAGRIAEAAAMASRRTRNAGLVPAPIEWDREDFPSTEDFAIRLAASLMLPISNRRLLQLWSLVSRRERLEESTA